MSALASNTGKTAQLSSGAPGLQKTQRTGVEVTVYPLPDRGITQPGQNSVGAQPYTMDGTGFHSDRPCVVACTVTNAMQSGGSFTVVVKSAQHASLLGSLSDDSWVDISFTNNGKSWHVMRGLVDEVRVSQNISGSGAYVVTQTIVGRSFQKIWASNSYYFNVNSYENLQGTLILKLLNSLASSDPKTVNQVFLKDVLAVLGTYNRGIWAMPPSMPRASNTFVNSFNLYTGDYGFYDLPQIAYAASFAQSGTGDLWSIAQQYSDPMFTELFTDQVAYNKTTPTLDLNGDAGLPIGSTAMTVIFRDKPFITVDPVLPADKLSTATPVKKGPFFNLPTYTLARQQIQSTDLGVNGYERFNAFFTSPPPLTEDGQVNFQYFQQPLWFQEDMQKHGMRRMDITSIWSPDQSQFDTYPGLTTDVFLERRRALIKDWYCLGAQMLSGTITLGCGAPHIKVGCRLKIAVHSPAIDTSSYYIESVSHAWSMPQGTRTQIGVTRGWMGDDTSLLSAIQSASSCYKLGTIGDGSVS